MEDFEVVNEMIDCPHCNHKQAGFIRDKKAIEDVYSNFHQYHKICEKCRKDFVFFMRQFKIPMKSKSDNQKLDHQCKDTCSGYKQGFEAGQASRTPIKWPTVEEFDTWWSKQEDDNGGYCPTTEQTLEWLKSFIEEEL